MFYFIFGGEQTNFLLKFAGQQQQNAAMLIIIIKFVKYKTSKIMYKMVSIFFFSFKSSEAGDEWDDYLIAFFACTNFPKIILIKKSFRFNSWI